MNIGTFNTMHDLFTYYFKIIERNLTTFIFLIRGTRTGTWTWTWTGTGGTSRQIWII